MDKINRFFKRKSIKTAFIVYLILCIFFALLLSFLFSNFCEFLQSKIDSKYLKAFEDTKILVEMQYDGERNEEMKHFIGIYPKGLSSFFTSTERFIYKILDILSILFTPICFTACIILTSMKFYNKQLRVPLKILDEAADRIAEHNLDFQVVYEKKDELGKLCSSFEKMRVALQENNMEMWRQIEERKRLNAAFAHDLRTPLTVLKGQSEMLIKYAPQMPDEKVVSTAEMMRRHITRLESYVSIMSDLQRLEDIEIQRQPVNVNDMQKQMYNTGTSVCRTKKFVFQDISKARYEINIDLSVILQVYENLLANAVRFANEMVTVTVDIGQDTFAFTVEDDGKGFTDEDLANVDKPFYKSRNETGSEHFGMGIYICKILCEKHGGYLGVSNHHGAAVTAVFQSC